METNNINTNNELEQMRAQLEIMKQKLSRQEIINDSLISRTMSSRMWWKKKYIWFETFVLLPFIAIIYALFTFVFHIPLWLYIIIVVLCIADVYADYRINTTNPADWIAGNLVETAGKLVKMKRLRMIHFAISVLAAIIVFGFLCYTLIANSDSAVMTGSGIGFAVGGCAGLVIAYMIYRRMQRTNDDLIRQIDELANERGENI